MNRLHLKPFASAWLDGRLEAIHLQMQALKLLSNAKSARALLPPDLPKNNAPDDLEIIQRVSTSLQRRSGHLFRTVQQEVQTESHRLDVIDVDA
jgi:hypothetical protein